MLVLLIIIVVIILGVYLFMQHPKFGRFPAGARLYRIKNSPNYRDGQFQNQHPTEQLTDGANMWSVMKAFFFGDKSKRVPPAPLPAQHTDLHSLDPGRNVLVWFGHSSYFIQASGIKILVDPVFSGNASPIPGTTKSFPGSDVYSVADMPEIDLLILTHDHWDHLDYATLLKLKPKVKKIVTTLGTGAHLERWGYDTAIINECDWYDALQPMGGFKIAAMPARHFSGRTFRRNKALWASFVVVTPSLRLFLGGDSGYDTHFVEIGEKYGPFDLAILEDGQYNRFWKHIHMMPNEVVQAAVDLKARRLLPVHWGKFSLSVHDWDEPIRLVTAESMRRGMPVLHPMIGEILDIDHPAAQNTWWEQVKR